MITGATIWKKLCIGDSRTRESTVSTDLDANLTVAGLEAGVGLSKGKKSLSGAGLAVQKECDISFRARKFQYSRFRRGMRKARNMKEGAIFKLKSGTGEVPLTNADTEAKYDEKAVSDGFESEDEEG